MRTKRCYKVAFVVRCPNAHYPTFYQNLALHPQLNLTVYYCSKTDFSSADYGKNTKDWGIDLLCKYNCNFLKNFSIGGNRSRGANPFSLINPQICVEIKKNRFDAVVIGGWDNITFYLAMLTAKIFGIPVMLMSDSNYIAEAEKPKYKIIMKHLLLGKCLFPIASACLYRGTATKQFYRHYGVPENKLFHFPFSTDTDEFIILYQDLKGKKVLLRSEMGIPENAFVILFVGRFHTNKSPMDLLKAYEQVESGKKALIFVGEGPLKKDLQDYMYQHNLSYVYFPGFQNRVKIPRFYAAADLLVHPASFEPWGMTVHEAMCFGLPVITTDKVGSAVDLVKHNQNGFIYPCGDIESLVSYIEELAVDRGKGVSFGKMSLEIVKNWTHKEAINGLIEALDFVYRDYTKKDIVEAGTNPVSLYGTRDEDASK